MNKQFLDKDGLQIVAEKVNEAREVGAGAMALAQEVSETSTIAFTGTFAQWNALSAGEKAKFAGHIVNITDDTTDVPNAVRNPDWSRAISVNFAQLAAGYVCPEDGIIIIQVASTDSSVFVTVNNKNICVNNMNQYAAATVAVGTGDIVKSTVTCQAGFIWFIPYTTSLVTTEPTNYSTIEQFTGKFWIDGKPIYRKVHTETVNTYIDDDRRRNIKSICANGVDTLIAGDGYTELLTATVGQGTSYKLGNMSISSDLLFQTSVNMQCYLGEVTTTFTSRTDWGVTSVKFVVWMEYTKSN